MIMKVNSAELKLHLGRYLRSVERDSATLEVCIRDRTVAYLIPATDSPSGRLPGRDDVPELILKKAGFKVEVPKNPTEPLPEPVVAGDGLKKVATVEAMRGGRDW